MSRFLKRLCLTGLIVACAGPLLAQAPKPIPPTTSAQPAAAPSSVRLGLGRVALPAEIKAWDIDVRPDGVGLPPGKGTVRLGDELFQTQCASCHGEFGQGNGRWPVLAGGQDSLKSDRPDKTVGSFWPELSTVYDYIRRAMPYGNAQSLTTDEIYSLTAYVLFLNDIVKDETFELSDKNLTTIKLPNAGGFHGDDRENAEKSFWSKEPCMRDCKGEVKIIGRAAVLDVTPDSKSAPKVD